MALSPCGWPANKGSIQSRTPTHPRPAADDSVTTVLATISGANRPISSNFIVRKKIF